ncbi:MAG: radical SAM protein [Sedimentibacter sp.]|nr:radical SAM protein [Sedimentibacter sp.]
MNISRELYQTQSLCPECLKVIWAKVIEENDAVYMHKSCDAHGEFKTVIWRDKPKIEDWINKKNRVFIKNPLTERDKGCPYDCGLCPDHRQTTCTALIEVTNDCNLYCRFCFAGAGDKEIREPSLKKIEFYYDRIIKQSGICNVQISGGEPTVRDDLDEIIRIGKDKGFDFIQINTNGIRIGEDEDYLRKLKEAGLSSVYLQFDGTQDEIYSKIRGRDLLKTKIDAINNCSKHNIGVVLVPVVIPGVNDHNIGEMIKFALDYTPTVRGIHFQPVSYFGRIEAKPSDDDRITLPEVMEKIESQTKGMIKAENLKPACCENALCSFNGSFIYDKEKNLKPITKNEGCKCTTPIDAAEGAARAKKFVSKNWKVSSVQKSKKLDSWELLANELKMRTFSISAMAFQDAYNVDMERLKDCCIHVVREEGNLIPFCAFNITDISGNSIYR